MINKSLKNLIIFFLLSIASGFIELHAAAGKVVYSYGEVKATAVDGTIRELQRGDAVNKGDTVNTANGRTQIRFSDGGFVALQPETQYRLDDYSFGGVTDGSEKSFFYLIFPDS